MNLPLTTARGRVKACWMAALLCAVAALALPGIASADQTITSSGPLTDIGVGSDLSCSVNYTGDNFGEFYGNTACGTFLDVGGPIADGGTVYGTPDLPAAGSVRSTPYTEDAQTPISGDGSSGNPFRVSTQVDAGSTGLSMTQTDTYVIGADEYDSTLLITNSSSKPQTVVLYHGADCYLGNADFGYGYQDAASGGIFCTKNAENSPAGRVEGFIPVDGGSNYLETFYNSMWTAIGTGQPLPDSCDCSTYEDNSMAISWTLTVPAGGSATRSWKTDFSPVGSIRASSYVALGDSVAAGEGIAENWNWNGSTWSQGTPFSWDTTSGQTNANCHQTLDGYPHVLATLLSANLLDLACTGAGTTNGILDPEAGLTGPQLGQGSSANSAYDNAAPDVVTLTVGADDIDFKDKVEACYEPLVHACGTGNDLPNLLSELSTFRTNLADTLNEIVSRGQADGKIPVVAITEYYSPFPNTYPTNSSCIDISPNRRLGVTLTDAEMQYLKQGLLDLNGTIDDVAATFPNVVIVPAPASFSQHRWCSSDPWVYGPSIDSPRLTDLLPGDPAPFHPTPEGQTAIADNVAQFLSEERHVTAGNQVPVDFGDIALDFSDVVTAGTAFFNDLSLSDIFPAARIGTNAPGAQAPSRAAARDTQAAADNIGNDGSIPPTSSFDPVAIYSAGTSATYTNGLTVTIPAQGASALYEVIDGAWQQIPTTSDGSNLTATLTKLGTLALGNPASPVSAAFTVSGDDAQAPASISFDASSSSVGSGSITSYNWDFGDGSGGTGETASHVYTSAGTYTVTLTTTSDEGAQDELQKTVTVTDAPPVAVVRYPSAATAGVPTSGFDASASHAASGAITDVFWDFGDQSATGSGETPTHTYATSGVYNVTTTVFDDEGASGTQTGVVAVAPAPGTPSPTVTVQTVPPPTGGSPSPTKPQRAKLSFGKHVAFHAGRLALSVTCAASGAACRGKLKLVVKAGRRLVTVATGTFALKSGKRATLFLRVRRLKGQLKTANLTVASAKSKGQTVVVALGVRRGRAK